MKIINDIHINEVETEEYEGLMYETSYKLNVNNKPIEDISFRSIYNNGVFTTEPLNFNSLEEFEIYQYALKRTYVYILKSQGIYNIISEGEEVFGVDRNKNPFYGQVVSIDPEDNVTINLIKYSNLSVNDLYKGHIKIEKSSVSNINDKEGLKAIYENRICDQKLKIKFSGIDEKICNYDAKIKKINQTTKLINNELSNIRKKETTINREKAINQKEKGLKRLAKLKSNLIAKRNNALLEKNEFIEDKIFVDLYNEIFTL